MQLIHRPYALDFGVYYASCKFYHYKLRICVFLKIITKDNH